MTNQGSLLSAPPVPSAPRRVAIVHEWLVNHAGSEKVVEHILKLFPHADLFAVVDFLSPKEREQFLNHKTARTTFIQRLPDARTRFRNYLPLMPLAVEQHDLTGYDLVISSSHAVAKGVLTGPDQLHICYIHSPIRYAWDMQHQYLRESNLEHGVKGMFARMVLHYMRLWDTRTAFGVDQFIANSAFIARRLRKVYRRPAQVIHPPVEVSRLTPHFDKENFYLTASRMVPYKRIPLIVEAFARMPDRHLVVIGDGPDMDKVKALAAPNVFILGYRPDEVLVDHMQRAKAFVFAAEEDFGITPVEAQACGTPVIAYGRGGSLETVRGHGDPRQRTGLFFDTQSVDAIVEAVEAFEALPEPIDPLCCRAHAEQFSAERFRSRFRAAVQQAWQAFHTYTPQELLLPEPPLELEQVPLQAPQPEAVPEPVSPQAPAAPATVLDAVRQDVPQETPPPLAPPPALAPLPNWLAPPVVQELTPLPELPQEPAPFVPLIPMPDPVEQHSMTLPLIPMPDLPVLTPQPAASAAVSVPTTPPSASTPAAAPPAGATVIALRPQPDPAPAPAITPAALEPLPTPTPSNPAAPDEAVPPTLTEPTTLAAPPQTPLPATAATRPTDPLDWFPGFEALLDPPITLPAHPRTAMHLESLPGVHLTSANPPITDLARAHERRLGDIIRARRPLTDSDVEHILVVQKRMKLRFGEAAVALDLVTQNDVLWALSQQFNYPHSMSGPTGDSALYGTDLVVAADPYGAQAEAFRDLRSKIIDHDLNAGRTPIAIVSPDHGDGRTYVAANLAMTFSQLGERTVLVDGNLRAPGVHKLFGLRERASLSDLLNGRRPARPFDRSNDMPGLFIMQVGAPPPNPLELLQQPIFSVLIRELQREFDRVIVDTPPARHSADARVIASVCKQSVLVGRQGKTPARSLNLLVDRLRRTQAGITGVVLNAH